VVPYVTKGWVGQSIDAPNLSLMGESSVRVANKLRKELYLEKRRQSAAENSCFFGKPRDPEPQKPVVLRPKSKISMLKFYTGGGEENLFADGCHKTSFNTRPISRAMPPLQEMDSKPPVAYDSVQYIPGPESMLFQVQVPLKPF